MTQENVRLTNFIDMATRHQLVDRLGLVGLRISTCTAGSAVIVETQIVQHQMFYGNFVSCEVERLSNKQSLQISTGNKTSLSLKYKSSLSFPEVSYYARRKKFLFLLFSPFNLQ